MTFFKRQLIAVNHTILRPKTPQKNPDQRGFSWVKNSLVLLLPFHILEIEDAEFDTAVYQQVVAGGRNC